MCAIAGLYDSQGGAIDAMVVQAMIRRQAHRGPDGEGYVFLSPDGQAPPYAVQKAPWAVPPATRYAVGLGHCRLKIVDLSMRGHQPMAGADGRCWVTYNGEIYNYIELREELRGKGHQFISTSDTEVLLAAYREWGEECLQRLNGMFAFALWDADRRVLWCARDRFGEKPFYYHWDGRQFRFASEIKALFEAGVPAQPCLPVIARYLETGSLDDGDQTFFEAITQLEPGQVLTVNEHGVMRRRYWTVPGPSQSALGYDDVVARFREVLEDAVRIRLRSDVPVGSCLSGGLDSSAIVCLMSRLGDSAVGAGTSIHAFSACYDDPRYDERRFMIPVVTATNAEWHTVFPRADRVEDDLAQLVAQADEPFGSTSIYAQWTVMRAVRQHGIKVVLDGQGADELLGGYQRFVGALIGHDVRRRAWGSAARQFRSFVRRHGWPDRHAMAELSRTVLPARVTASLRDTVLRSRSWMGDALRSYGDEPVITRAPDVLSPFRRLQRNLLTGNGLRALLRNEDRNAMAFGVEARLPFLDHRLVELVQTIPDEWYLRYGWTKALLRDALQGVLPEPVRTRRDKVGFATPESDWFRTGLRTLVREILSDRRTALRGFLNTGAAVREFDRFIAGGTLPSVVIWRWVNLELWARTYVDRHSCVASSF